MINRVIFGLALATVSSLAMASGVAGVWATEAGKDGGHLEVTMAPCDKDSSKTCGKISRAYGKTGVDAGYSNLGKIMVSGMSSDDGKSYSGGTIWDPEKDKTYKSKMHLKGDDLDVEGCISFFCSGQDWKRVK